MSEAPIVFGTDGVRGVANETLTPELVTRLGRAIGSIIGEGPVLIGRDTRRSGPMLEAAITAGLAAQGRDVIHLGVTTTPVVAWWCSRDGRAGVMLSASHNPFADNGVKVFAPGGRKLSDAEQAAIELALHGPEVTSDTPLVGVDVGAISEHDDPHGAYLDWLLSTVDGRRLDGLRVVVDGANGSAFDVGPAAFRRAGADVVVIGDAPNGTNINRGCGSTDLAALQHAVVDNGAALGIAFDGDADRMLAVDDRGEVVDGDHLLALFARDLRSDGRLTDDTVVVTIMTNLGFRIAMADDGIRVVETDVGDRYVLAELDANGWSLGGEQSGHVIFRDLAGTGDGVLAGLHLAELVDRAGVPLSQLAAAAMTSVPQVLVNIPVARVGAPPPPDLADAIAAAEAELGERGRILVRASGTEPLLRIMVEAIEPDLVDGIADRLASTARHLLAQAN